jgi:hypothetical protein
MARSVDVVIEDPGLVVAHVGDVCVAIPRGEADVMLVSALHRGIELLARQRERGIALLFIVSERCTAPTGKARTAAGLMFEELRPSLRVVAAHIAGHGFLVSVKRSIFTWATSRMVGKTPLKTFSSVTVASQWLEDQCRLAGITSASGGDLEAIVKRYDAAGERVVEGTTTQAPNDSA